MKASQTALRRWVSTALVRYLPRAVAAEHRRAFGLTTAGYLFAFMAQVVLATLAFVAGEPVGATVLTTGAAGFALCLAAHLGGVYRAPPHLATLIVVSEGILGVHFLGVGSGFQLYILAAIVYPWLAPFFGGTLRLSYTLVGGATFAGLFAYGVAHQPAYSLALPWQIVFSAINASGAAGMLVAIISTYESAVERAELEARRANAQSEALLRNILPGKVAERLKRDPHTIAEVHRDVTILFADIVQFTALTERLSPSALVDLLNEVFSAFDDLVVRFGAEKIKTIGDAYMAAAGLPEATASHAAIIAELALSMLETVDRMGRAKGFPIQLRIGVNSGTVVAGVIGKTKFSYDLWGDPVNTAGRMESHGVAGKIQVGETTFDLLKEKYNFEYRGIVDLKGKGPTKTWCLLSRKQAPGVSGEVLPSTT